MTKRLLPVCAAVLLMSVPCMAQAQGNDVSARLNRLENEINTLNRAVYRGETPPPRPYVEQNAGGTNIEVRLQQLESQIRDLTGQLEQQNYDLQQIQTKLDQMQGAAPSSTSSSGGYAPMPERPTDTIPLYRGASEVVEPPVLIDQNPTSIDIPQPKPKEKKDESAYGMQTRQPLPASDAAGLYESAFAKLKTASYDDAQKGFEAFLEAYPDHALAANATYWLGETHYVRGDFAKAAKVFAEAYQKYPNGPKGADNLLKMAMSLRGLNKDEQACVALGQLMREYPNGPAPVLRRGEQEMADLDCR